MNNLKKSLFAAFIVLISSMANAAGLGPIKVLSALGQPFHAEIDLIGIQKNGLDSFSANLASHAAYQRAGLDYNATVASLTLELQKRANGEPYIRVSSLRPVTDFVVSVLVDATWDSGHVIRAYSVPLDLARIQ